jgi:hypothetical protein
MIAMSKNNIPAQVADPQTRRSADPFPPVADPPTRRHVSPGRRSADTFLPL